MRGLRLGGGIVGLCSLMAKLLIGASDVAKRHGGSQRRRGCYLIEAMVGLGGGGGGLLKSRRDTAACGIASGLGTLRSYYLLLHIAAI